MKLAIVGSRTYTDFTEFEDKLRHVVGWYVDPSGIGDYADHGDLEVISGGAKGVDTLAERWAKENHVSCKVIKPEYDEYDPKVAPLIRNTKIAEECDELVAFWDGRSKGTEDIIKKAVQFGKQVTIFGITKDV